MYQALYDLPFPSLCKVHGHAMGGALGLIGASDVVVAESKTQFCFSEVRLGLAPAVISAFVTGKMRRADIQRYFLSAEVFDGEQAHRMGLVQEYGSLAEVDNWVQKITKKFCQNGPVAVRETKAMIRDLMETQNKKELTTRVIAKLRVSDEGQEGLKAFFEKRKPKWLEPSQ